MRMQAAVLDAPAQPFDVREVELDEPRGGEVLVQIAASGLCGSDLKALDGLRALAPFPVDPRARGRGRGRTGRRGCRTATPRRPRRPLDPSRVRDLRGLPTRAPEPLRDHGHRDARRKPARRLQPPHRERPAAEPLPHRLLVRRPRRRARVRGHGRGPGHAAGPRCPDRVRRAHGLRSGAEQRARGAGRKRGRVWVRRRRAQRDPGRAHRGRRDDRRGRRPPLASSRWRGSSAPPRPSTRAQKTIRSPPFATPPTAAPTTPSKRRDARRRSTRRGPRSPSADC